MKEQEPKTEAPHARTINEVANSLGSDAAEGLSRREAQQRLEQSGYNELKRHKARSPWRILLEQFHGVLLWVLLVALAVALALQEWPEAVAIAAVILVNTLIGFLAEWKATRTIDALRQKEEVHATVIRDGEAEDVPVRELVPGDLIELKPEKIVPADARVVESAGLRIDEAALTGESGPVSKDPDPVDGNTPLAERSCMVFKGCAVVDGGGRALVTGTGMQTELGNIADAAMHAESGETPLRVRLDQLGRRFVWLVLISCVFVGVAGWWRGRGTAEIIETAVALGIAAVPEGLPIVASIALAHGMWKMGKHNAIVKKLQAVQALGSVPVLFVDKTGTLTQNRMQLVRVSTPSGDWDPAGSEAPDVAAAEVLEVGVLCNGAEIKEDKEEGDPMEIALLKAGYKYGRGKDRPEEELSHLRTVQFDRETMMMAAYHQRKADDTLHVSVKGAPERVLQACSRIRNGNRGKDLDGPGRKEWTHKAEELAGEGLRLLGAARKRVQSEEEDPYSDLEFLGFFGLEDPPRVDVEASIDECQAAGIHVIMVTGDKPATAAAVAAQTGIKEQDQELEVLSGKEVEELDLENEEDARRVSETDVVARVEPKQKMALVEAVQSLGKAAGMTGDGINDAPALKRANIGIAMGERGTEAAKQVADIVLRDDSLATIVEAVRRGRTIMDNIRKAVMFMLCTNLAEIIAVTIGVALDYPLPLLALQILYLNVVTDVFPALALGVGPPVQGLMNKRTLESSRSILTASHWSAIVVLGVVLATTTLVSLVMAIEVLGLSATAATTVSFMTLGFSKVWFPFNLRHVESPFLLNEITRNAWLWLALLLCVMLLLIAVYGSPLAGVLDTAKLPLNAWGLVLALSLVPLVLSQVFLLIMKLRAAS